MIDNLRLDGFETAPLKEGEDALFKRRFDTKYIVPAARLAELFGRLNGRYRISRYKDRSVQPYESAYFDDANMTFYRDHQRGKLSRFKVRMRYYPASGFTCLEIKMKTNRAATRKWRRPISLGQFEAGLLTAEDRAFMDGKLEGHHGPLAPQVRVRFKRLSLESRDGSERITFDWNLAYVDPATKDTRSVDGLIVAEVKQARRAPGSPFRRLMRDLRIVPSRFSKYCYGVYLFRPCERHNRLKPDYSALERKIRRASTPAAPAPAEMSR